MEAELDELLSRPAPEVAARLIGAHVQVDGVGGIIVETEAYDVQDAASHSFRGPTPHNAPMFGPTGRAYVYRIYGLHLCLNIVCDAASSGSAVLIRALEPVWGLAIMAKRRSGAPTRELCAGPGRLCQALGVTREMNGWPIDATPFSIALQAPASLVVGPRIGISRAAETPWRFGLAGSRYVSRPFRAANPA